jgi:hypothetical protein
MLEAPAQHPSSRHPRQRGLDQERSHRLVTSAFFRRIDLNGNIRLRTSGPMAEWQLKHAFAVGAVQR